MNEDVMVIPLRVPRETGRAWKLEAVKQDKSVQKWIIEQVGCERGTSTNGDAQRGVAKAQTKNVKATLDVASESKSPAPRPSTPPRPPTAPKQAIVESVVTTGGLVKPTPVVSKFGVPVQESEVPMAKCRKCGDSFPVADMITEPKTGKLFCADCVENMKNGQ